MIQMKDICYAYEDGTTALLHVFQMSNFKTANDAVNRIAAYILERTEYN